MKIAYYLNEGRKKNLYCRISDGTERTSFSLGYTIDPKEWNEKQEEGSFEDPYYFTLMSFKNYLSKRYHELKSIEIPVSNVLATLKNEAETFINGSGIEGIARKMFDDENNKDLVPTYDQFIQAFEKYSDLPRSDYQARAVDNIIYFHTKNGTVFEMDTYQGLSARLEGFINRRSYSEIFSETEQSIWSAIYVDAGINKHAFLPKMLKEWERYWYRQFEEFGPKAGKTTHLEDMKQQSWRQFQVFMECYDDTTDIIKLTYEIDDMGLYPISVLTMLNIFSAGVCYEEYCEWEFERGDEWTSIDLFERDDEDEEEGDSKEDDAPIFFVRKADF